MTAEGPGMVRKWLIRFDSLPTFSGLPSLVFHRAAGIPRTAQKIAQPQGRASDPAKVEAAVAVRVRVDEPLLDVRNQGRLDGIRALPCSGYQRMEREPRMATLPRAPFVEEE